MNSWSPVTTIFVRFSSICEQKVMPAQEIEPGTCCLWSQCPTVVPQLLVKYFYKKLIIWIIWNISRWPLFLSEINKAISYLTYLFTTLNPLWLLLINVCFHLWNGFCLIGIAPILYLMRKELKNNLFVYIHDFTNDIFYWK